MKRIFSVLGGVFLVLLIFLGGFFGYAVYQGRHLDASSKAYVEKNIPPILTNWSKAELIKRASPSLLKLLDSQPKRMNLLFKRLSRLGTLKHFFDINGQSREKYTTRGRQITAAYTARGKFENGDALIVIRLLRTSGRWQIAYFRVNSPLFLQ